MNPCEDYSDRFIQCKLFHLQFRVGKQENHLVRLIERLD